MVKMLFTPLAGLIEVGLPHLQLAKQHPHNILTSVILGAKNIHLMSDN